MALLGVVKIEKSRYLILVEDAEELSVLTETPVFRIRRVSYLISSSMS
jgi:hypothetical protein